MADEAAVSEEDVSPAQTPLVTLSFQRDDSRKQKYLESEPKVLGITQIGLSLFNITCASVFLAKDLSYLSQTPLFISSLLVAIAGSVAIAAQNLHLRMLRACLGMQIVACGASFVNLICTLANIVTSYAVCHMFYNSQEPQTCTQLWKTHTFFYAESAIIQAALFAISATLAAYCCKVVNCCAPAPKMPVITVQAPVSNSQEADKC